MATGTKTGERTKGAIRVYYQTHAQSDLKVIRADTEKIKEES